MPDLDLDEEESFILGCLVLRSVLLRLGKQTHSGRYRAGRAGYGHWDFWSRDFERK
jgi:hypothetical protein